MIHRVEELVFVDEGSDDEIQQAKKQHKPGTRQNAVDNADDEDEYGLRKVEAIAEDRGLNQFCVIYVLNQQLAERSFDTQIGLYLEESWHRLGRSDIMRRCRIQANGRETAQVLGV